MITVSQLLLWDCRNRRRLEYHSLSVRSYIHRQSGTWGIKTQHGHPIAPAKWAMAVSAVINKSSFVTVFAESVNELKCCPKSVKSGVFCIWNRAGPTCKLTKLNSGHSNIGENLIRGMDLFASLMWSGLPAQTSPILGLGGFFFRIFDFNIRWWLET